MTLPAHTKTDGAAAARYAAGLLGVATCAETTATTMAEDAAKVDVKFSFRHIAAPGKVITAHAQVKAGPSYRRASSDAQFLALGIDKATLQALSGTGMPGLVIWVPPPPMDRLYWYATDPRSALKTPAKLRRTQYLRPSLRYDLSRLYDYASWSRRYTKQTVGRLSSTQIMPKAKEAFKALKAQAWDNPLVGNLQITRLAWRHITRRSKSQARRTLSLRIVPYLKAFLASPPDRYACNFVGLQVNGPTTTETRYLMCWYRQALAVDGESHSLLIRIREEITYPTEWATRPLSAADVKQIAVLAAWWCKKDK
ncbi:hypothetical protein [Rhodocyclus tenuis]|uniref:DUF4365 domain-containing protein n=1 Tax=Rhodocyclus tenuis TaxID=1066 RepID=A0A840G0L4_RHOTE|nr:hypothetical protein [Rhodocyclus tenuis]MBB4246013.1 hypothetical protein [Rhodocyclus tenuis]